ncbi:Alcohol dehydrogenase superfamily zinc-type [Penicillium cataractarum]|uniref:Alcohol dehydrogenase superfamily zinc-type n=1 Tax=Penicillium cataractarum TaxID=2100454 RepID=A0A9W9RYM3_9EURO|nr:Alcohol dehydrogenase superfamily zinc-type [Penicillium cataractarum]KAJ5368778.1 Alcohol dehydrogenase superfamily zinc-type [Penicillium cataractarum]
MSVPKNQAAWLVKAGSPLELGDATMPTAGSGELVIKNAAIAINPLDFHMQDSGVFIQQWPAIFGCDIAGEVYEAAKDVTRFKPGDRVIGYVAQEIDLLESKYPKLILPLFNRHAISLTSGRPQDGAFALYTVIPADKAAVLPNEISFTDGVVVPFALEAAVCALSLKKSGVAMPGVATPALGLPYPSIRDVPSAGKTLVVYGGSSSVGSMAIQIATAAGIHVIAISGAHNFYFCKRCGAARVFDHKDTSLAGKVIEAIRESDSEFIGIFDAISTPETYANDITILEQLDGGHLACVHPPPPATDLPGNVRSGMIFAVNDVVTPVWKDYVTPALQSGKLQCLPPPFIVGKGLKHIQSALEKSKAGVSAMKLVVEL